jgi:hypothetical protein
MRTVFFRTEKPAKVALFKARRPMKQLTALTGLKPRQYCEKDKNPGIL